MTRTLIQLNDIMPSFQKSYRTEIGTGFLSSVPIVVTMWPPKIIKGSPYRTVTPSNGNRKWYFYHADIRNDVMLSYRIVTFRKLEMTLGSSCRMVTTTWKKATA